MNNLQCQYPNCKENAVDSNFYCILHDAVINDF